MEFENLKAYISGGLISCDQYIEALEKKILREVLQPIQDEQKIDTLKIEHVATTTLRKYITDLIKTFPELSNEQAKNT